MLDMKLDTFYLNTQHLQLYDKDNKIVSGKTLKDLYDECKLDGDILISNFNKKKFDKLDDKQKKNYLIVILKLHNKGNKLADSLTYSLSRAGIISQEDNGKRMRFSPDDKFNDKIIKGAHIKDNKEISFSRAYSKKKR